MSPEFLSFIANHLWQSTLFAAVAGLLTLALRNNRARVRHWVWLAASWKFLVPFSVLISLGGQIHWRTAPHRTQPDLAVVLGEISQPMALTSRATIAPAVPAAGMVPTLAWSIWACGFLGIAGSWRLRWRRIRTAVRTGSPVRVDAPIRAVSSPTLLEPGVFGVLRPVLLLPDGILDELTPAQLRGVIAHEFCHVRRHDNLVAAIQMFVETLFWFHPLVWWLGRRMVEERELACDQEVLSLGNEPRVYAEGILNVCKLYVKSPLSCLSGATGADLNKRIESIMRNRVTPRLDFTRRAILTIAGGLAVVAPIGIGIVHAPPLRAQSSADQKRLTFDAASVKPATPPPGLTVVGTGMSMAEGSDFSRYRSTGGPGTNDPGRIHYPLASLTGLLKRAYAGYFEIKAPAWADTDIVAVDATMPVDTTKEQFLLMLRSLLADRFALKTHVETKEIAGYALNVARGGPKVKEAQPDNEPVGPTPGRTGADGFPVPPAHMRGLGNMIGENDRARLFGRATMAELANRLGDLLDTAVEDRTALNGTYSISVTYAGRAGGPHGATALLQPPPPSADASAPEPLPDIFSALQTELGLKLEKQKVSVKILVVDHLEKTPSGN